MAFADRINKAVDEIADRSWRRGYFCAVSVLLREQGAVSQEVRSLFRQGGSIEGIDSLDRALFREHGLID